MDIDADLLISRIAPVDMILQRIGRLWRHEKLTPLRSATASRSAVILEDELLSSRKHIQSGTFLPYDDYQICRTYEELSRKSFLQLPEDIRPVLEAVYCEREETGALQMLKGNLSRKIDELETRADLSVRSKQASEDDDRIFTRINAYPTVQLLILKKNNGGRVKEDALCPKGSDRL